jgi:TatD DNase family protein
MFDSHCHLDVAEFAPDRAAVLARARASGVHEQLIPAINAAHWDALAELCQAEPGLYPAFGLHPMFLNDHQQHDLLRLAEVLERHPKALVGECGLDYFVSDANAEVQLPWLRAQLQLAADLDRPVILHARRAFDAILIELKRAGVKRGIVHSFSGSEPQARALIKQGMQLGIGGPLTYPRAARLRAVFAAVPLEHIVIETDSPDQPVCGFQGQRNEPMRLTYVAEALALARSVDVARIAEQTSLNARSLVS